MAALPSKPSLLPPNATPAERAVEAVLARIADLPTPHADLWNPDTCPARFLPWLAWTLSIDDWQPYWPEYVKRERIRVAIAVQRRKGTAKSVRDVVAAFGGAVDVREWWQTGGAPHTFALTLTLAGEDGQEATARYVDDVIAEVRRTKPVRSHFTFTQGIQGIAKVGIVAAARPVIYRRMAFEAS